MTRKHYEAEGDQHDRWLISYADLITLLFAVFVVMYAISSVHEGKYRVLSASLGTAFGSKGNSAAKPDETDALPGSGLRALALRHERERLAQLAATLQSTLATLVEAGKVKVVSTAQGISVEINASVLFGSGDATLQPSSIEALQMVGAVLRDDPHAIQVEGHTDPVPIATGQYPSNWELSAVRAGSVVRLLAAAGVAPHRLSVVGRADTAPVSDNESEAGRARNRRVAIIILAALPPED